MKVWTPLIAWHNRDRVSAIDFQPFPHPKPTKDGGTRIATGGDDKHVIVSILNKKKLTLIYTTFEFILIC